MRRNGKSEIATLAPCTMFYRLDEHLRVMPVQADDFFGSPDLYGDYQWMYHTMLSDGTLVSSAFLGIAQPGYDSDFVCLFETMVFSPDNQPIEREHYSNIEKCIQGHHKVVDRRNTELDLKTLSRPSSNDD